MTILIYMGVIFFIEIDHFTVNKKKSTKETYEHFRNRKNETEQETRK